VVGAEDEGLLHGAWRQTRRRLKLRRVTSGARSKPLRVATDSHTEESPEGGRGVLEPIFKRFGRSVGQRHEGNGERRARAAVWEGKTLKSEPWTWLRGETNPQRLAEEEAVEDVRNVEDGTKRAVGRPRMWTPPSDAAMRDGSPWEVPGHERRAGEEPANSGGKGKRTRG
jgi:hypothetical protein